jgi:RND superfamily putative drug exporter
MLTRIANLGIRSPKRVLGFAGIAFIVCAVFGPPVASKLSAGGFSDPNAASSQAKDILASRFHVGDPNLVLEVSAPAGADTPAARRIGMAAAQALTGKPYVSQVTSYWTAPRQQAAALKSNDGRSALVVAHVAGDDSDAPDRAAAAVQSLSGTRDGVTVKAGGLAIVYHQVNADTKSDLTKSEMIAIPLTVVALIWVFGSLVASLLPVAVGLASIVGTMAILRLLALVTSVSIYALNMTTALGLALAIDYSLFIVSRYREERHAGQPHDDAVRRTMQTAGRTVLFSALTVGLSLAAMLVFPLYFLRSFAYAGIAVVALASLAAVVILPAVLTLLANRIDSLDLRAGLRRLTRRSAPTVKPVEQTFWYRFGSGVMRRALPVAVLVTAGLVALGLPFLGVKFGYPDSRVLPASESSYQVGQDMLHRYTASAASTVDAVIPSTRNDASAIGGYARQLSRVAGITSVASVAGRYADGRRVDAGNPKMTSGQTSYLALQTAGDPQSEAAKKALTGARGVAAPWPVLFGGQTAENHDSLHALGAAMPYAIGLIALATFVLLFLFTGSLVMPVKALILNTLSLSATFGAMVWIFQDGHAGWAFPDLTHTGFLTPTMPPLMFCLAFGLSMDYEVFLLSRIREAWLASGKSSNDTVEAVAIGLGRTGRIVTAAALLMAIVFAAISRSHVAFMMLFGAGLTLAVVMDATIVRGTLVPAFMRLAGRWNWWAPRPLAALHARFGLAEGSAAPTAAVADEPVPVA